MINFWRFLFGYIIIKINGENSEKLLNTAIKNKIYIWNLAYKNGAIIGNISISDFFKLRYVKRKIKCKVHIIKKTGLLFHIIKYKRRTGFLFGFVIFICTLLFLSNFVWIINVEGNVNLSNEQILDCCKKIGIYEGVAKRKINSKYDAQKIQLTQEGIAWCSLNLEGSILTINVSETTISDKKEREKPSNIKAVFSGKIKKIDVKSGKTLIKVGDYVSNGDLLVSGIVDDTSNIHFVHSEGTIIAQTKREFSAQGDFTQTQNQEIGKTINRYTINFFNAKIPLYLGNIKNSYNLDLSINQLKFLNKKIPIKIAHEQYKLTSKTSTTYESVVLEKMLYNEIKKQLESHNFISAVETQKTIINTPKGMLLKITYDCEENIAIQDEILMDTEIDF